MKHELIHAICARRIQKCENMYYSHYVKYYKLKLLISQKTASLIFMLQFEHTYFRDHS